MYGAMELQKYGYDSALSAARLSYDLNQKQFAHQYYQDAVNAAITEAQITGTYFSAESRDMLSQYNVAEYELGEYKDMTIQELEEKISTGEVKLTKEQEHALEVKRNIVKWYDNNNVSPVGIKTLAAWEAEQTLAQQWADSQWEKYQAAKNSANNLLDTDANAFIKIDGDGNLIYNGLDVSTGNWESMSGKEILDYISNEDGTINSNKQQQLFSYIDTQIGGQISSGFNQYCTANEIKGDYEKALADYLAKSDALGSFINRKFKNVSSEDAEGLFNNLNGYTLDIAMPDGTTWTYTLECSTGDDLATSEGTKKKTWSSYEEAVEAGYPDILTEEAFLNQEAELKDQYATYQDYLDAKYKEYNPVTLPEKPMITKDYTDGGLLMKDLLSNESFEGLINLLDAINWEEDPSRWYDDVNNGWAQLYNFLGFNNRDADIYSNISQMLQAKDGVDYAKFGEYLTQIKASIVYQMGDANYDLLIETYNNYAELGDREKGLMPEETRRQYEEIAKLAKSMSNIDKAIQHCNNNDSSIWTNGWDYVRDDWNKVGEQWENVDNIGDFGVALGDTVAAIGNSVVGGVTGFFRWLFTGKDGNS
jgi:hypothetical protein